MNVLAISPHTDDIELGAGGYLARLIEEGASVYAAAFSTGDPVGGAIRDEFYSAMGVLGIKHIQAHHYKSRHLPDRRQDILDELLKMGDWAKPNLVLVPSALDTHQDHQTVVQEAIRAFRTVSVLGYELPWSNARGFTGNYYVPLKERHLLKKLQSIDAYESQRYRHYTGDYCGHLARMRGGQIKTEYAECFEVIRWVHTIR